MGGDSVRGGSRACGASSSGADVDASSPVRDSAAGAVGGSVQVDEKDSRAGGLAASTPMPRPPPPADFAAGAHPRRAFCAALEEREL
uniref:Uncharacterized protein n=1 Tax=Rangifer tarandus platyrhynchus TaxID=3082113 RepID=A0ACB0EX98_RANTA|nr:unnamed protein product [Rangifer tarandus platyrhynchus]